MIALSGFERRKDFLGTGCAAKVTEQVRIASGLLEMTVDMSEAK